MPAVRRITTPPKTYRPARRCIYCHRKATKLTAEHIIPHGIAGNSLILPAASCRACQETTRDTETMIQRNMWWPFRTKIGAPSSGKQPPTTFRKRPVVSAKFNDDGWTGEAEMGPEVDVSADDFPFSYYALHLGPCNAIAGKPLGSAVTYGLVTFTEMNEFARHHSGPGTGYYVGPMNDMVFARFLAKIAHAFAVAELGYKAVTWTLRRFIRGDDIHAVDWIGGDLELPPISQAMHEISCSMATVGASRYVVVNLRLFAFIGTPQYRIVVGELKSEFDEFTIFEKPPYAVEVELPLPDWKFDPVSKFVRTWS